MQYKCNNKDWKTTSSLSGSQCGFSPYTEVQCQVVAYNQAGNSTAAVSNPPIRTWCDSKSAVALLAYIIYTSVGIFTNIAYSSVIFLEKQNNVDLQLSLSGKSCTNHLNAYTVNF